MAAPDPNPTPDPHTDPFTAWYRDVIQAHPETYDPAHFGEAQARAWFPLWSGHGFRSSKVDAQGNPIQGDSFTHPDECPEGTTAYGANACVPVGAIPGQGHVQGRGGGPGGSGWDGSGYSGFSDFKMPDFTDDPGYKFRLDQGRQALESSAAAHGVLNTGGTLLNIEKFGQGLASQEYANAYQRAWDKYRFGVDDEFRREQLIAGIQPPY